MRKLLLIVCGMVTACVNAQQVKHYDLAKLYQDKAFLPSDSVSVSASGVLSTINTIWFKDLSFSEGTIDIDLRGQDVFLLSFLGIAFYSSDTAHYDVLYFRPFNFKSADTTRRKWSVAYVSLPDYPWPRLRKEHPLVYENAVHPVPDPNAWFHATIIIKGNQLTVYVNHNPTASLQVTLLSTNRKGRFGLFSDGLKSDFANLVISK